MTDIFYREFPFYIVAGMPAWDYWNGDATLVKYYREADVLRNRKKNSELHLQGMYNYEALCCVAPILHAFAKQGTRAHPYASEPYPLTKEEQEERMAAKRKAEAVAQRVAFEAYIARLAAQGLKERNEGANAG